MKRISFLFLVLIVFVSCNDDTASECSQENWLGTYEIISDLECEFGSMSSLIFNEMIIIAEGTSETTIDWDGDVVTFTECTATDGIITLTLNGNSITSKIGECEAIYNRF